MSSPTKEKKYCFGVKVTDQGEQEEWKKGNCFLWLKMWIFEGLVLMLFKLFTRVVQKSETFISVWTRLAAHRDWKKVIKSVFYNIFHQICFFLHASVAQWQYHRLLYFDFCFGVLATNGDQPSFIHYKRIAQSLPLIFHDIKLDELFMLFVRQSC